MNRTSRFWVDKKMGLANLEALGIEIELPPNIVYHHDGGVDNIWAHTVNLIGCNYSYPISPLGFESIQGRVQLIQIAAVKHYHLFYLKMGPALTALVRGHEETHFMKSVDRLNTRNLTHLSEVLQREHGLVVNLNDIYDKEVAASIGGIHAALRAGHSIIRLNQFQGYSGYLGARKYFEAIGGRTRT